LAHQLIGLGLESYRMFPGPFGRRPQVVDGKFTDSLPLAFYQVTEIFLGPLLIVVFFDRPRMHVMILTDGHQADGLAS
jgi:hypothetical protein